MKRRRLARSVRTSLAVALVAFATACVVLGLLIAYLGAVLSHRGELDRSILARASELLERHEAAGREGLVAAIAELGGGTTNGLWLYAYWSEETGTVWAGNTEPPRGHLSPGEPGDYRLGDLRARGIVYSLPAGNALLVARDVSRENAFERRLLIASISAGAAVVALSIGAGLWVSRSLVGRVEEMNRTVVSILEGARSERMQGGTQGDEFDELARHFNELLDENESLVSQVREVTNNIAHDLRTPLARVRNHLDAALERPRSGPEDAESLQAALDETNSLLETFQSILSIAQIESGAVRDALAPVDLTQIARDAVELYDPAAEDVGLALELDARPETTVLGNRHLLSQALTNLIDNAIKFSPAPGTIEISVRQGAEGPELQVADHGPGIPPGEREHVLRRFTRLDASREKPGTGLGLSLVAAVVEFHGAKLSLSDNEPGLVVRIVFPEGRRVGARTPDPPVAS